MKTNSNDSAFARPYSHDERPFTGMVEGDYAQSFYAYDGLTKREYFAAMALQGLAVDWSHQNGDIAHHAVNIADALIAELNKVPS